LRVCSSSAGMSEAMKFSPSPKPTITPRRSRCGPRRSFRDRGRQERERGGTFELWQDRERRDLERVPLPSSSSRRLHRDLGVRLARELVPTAIRGALSSSKFSMIPLWIHGGHTPQSTCGCAFCSFGRPCVAHLVGPMPVCPSRDATTRPPARLSSFPRRASRRARRSAAPRRRRSRTRVHRGAAARPSAAAAPLGARRIPRSAHP
jgi:hypothetical protein